MPSDATHLPSVRMRVWRIHCACAPERRLGASTQNEGWAHKDKEEGCACVNYDIAGGKGLDFTPSAVDGASAHLGKVARIKSKRMLQFQLKTGCQLCLRGLQMS